MSERAKLAELGHLIKDDGFAASFLSMGKYRSALLNKVLELLERDGDGRIEPKAIRPVTPPPGPPARPCRPQCFSRCRGCHD